MYSTTHPSNREKGGSAVLICNAIQHYTILLFKHDFIQSLSVHIKMKNFNLTFSDAHCLPHYYLNHITIALYLYTLGSHWIVGGDFNSKHIQWGSCLTTLQRWQLLQALNLTNTLPISTGKPTHWPTDSSKQLNLLDFFLVKDILKH